MWHDAKAASNRLDHGVSFEMARDAFQDGFAVDRIDDRHGDNEERIALIGMAGRRLLFVSYTIRGERIRIISARKAELPRAKTLHRADGLTQEQFAVRFQIPLGTLRDWEQGATEPDQAARAYLRAIAGDPVAVERALNAGPGVG